MSSLGNDPMGKDYEDYIAANLQSTRRYYVEKNIERKNVLELDIVTTNYSKEKPELKLWEIKSGNAVKNAKTNCEETEDPVIKCLFKVRGWMDYLGVKEGAYISKGNIGSLKKVKKVGKQLGIVVIDQVSTTLVHDKLSLGNINQCDVEVWECAYQTERKIIGHLQREKRDSNSHKKTKPYVNPLLNYYFQVNNDIFFLGNNIERINSLFKTYSKREFRHISARVGNVLCGGLFSDDVKVIPEQIYAKTYYGCECTDINVSTYIENRARLAILKNAVDYILNPDKSDENKLTHTFKRRIKKLKNKTDPDSLKRYPIFWQWFLWVFGGFILEDYEDQEFALLSKKTGIPVAEIPNALRAYDILFPLESGKEWLQLATQQKNIKLLSVFSVPFMGIGVKYRQSLYKEDPQVLKVLQSNKDLKKWADLSDKVLDGNC